MLPRGYARIVIAEDKFQFKLVIIKDLNKGLKLQTAFFNMKNTKFLQALSQRANLVY
jgi:hypothetical protein